MYNFMDSNSAVISVIFFVLVVLFGSFFLLNLILAVIMDNFNTDAHDAEDESKIDDMLKKLKLEEEKKGSEPEMPKKEESEEEINLEHSSKQLRPISEVVQDVMPGAEEESF
jgi:hypothetical protein